MIFETLELTSFLELCSLPSPAVWLSRCGITRPDFRFSGSYCPYHYWPLYAGAIRVKFSLTPTGTKNAGQENELITMHLSYSGRK
jgi:hypothetical protein